MTVKSVFGLWKKPVFSDVLFYSALRLYVYIFVHLPSFTCPISETQCDYRLHPYSRVGSLKGAFFQIATQQDSFLRASVTNVCSSFIYKDVFQCHNQLLFCISISLRWLVDKMELSFCLRYYIYAEVDAKRLRQKWKTIVCF